MRILERMKKAAPIDEKEIMGRLHPKMTLDLALQILPEGAPIDIVLLTKLGLLCNPMEYRVLPSGALMAIATGFSSLAAKTGTSICAPSTCNCAMAAGR